ncbi:hypothetical protein B484DRAFT_163863 [Ochromonadaceae sp. CCMP2298]|nr:hypothetical protein B484DRAFT_163863 [Ochromonadaceae sp. CCMP2298]
MRVWGWDGGGGWGPPTQTISVPRTPIRPSTALNLYTRAGVLDAQLLTPQSPPSSLSSLLSTLYSLFSPLSPLSSLLSALSFLLSPLYSLLSLLSSLFSPLSSLLSPLSSLLTSLSSLLSPTLLPSYPPTPSHSIHINMFLTHSYTELSIKPYPPTLSSETVSGLCAQAAGDVEELRAPGVPAEAQDG